VSARSACPNCVCNSPDQSNSKGFFSWRFTRLHSRTTEVANCVQLLELILNSLGSGESVALNQLKTACLAVFQVHREKANSWFSMIRMNSVDSASLTTKSRRIKQKNRWRMTWVLKEFHCGSYIQWTK
jgi:hypothetical protein